MNRFLVRDVIMSKMSKKRKKEERKRVGQMKFFIFSFFIF